MEPNAQANKFSEISPVLELIYVMLTNMNKYLQVYANDISAEKLKQYLDAKDALEVALKKFDDLYGLDSSVSSVTEETTMEEVKEEKVESNEFASATDPDAIKKAKEAVQELKTLFSDMKEEEENGDNANLPPIAEENKVASVEQIPTTVVEEAPNSQVTPPPVSSEKVQMPSPMNTQDQKPKEESLKDEKPVEQPRMQQDAAEIDSILAELRKLQNKGDAEL